MLVAAEDLQAVCTGGCKDHAVNGSHAAAVLFPVGLRRFDMPLGEAVSIAGIFSPSLGIAV